MFNKEMVFCVRQLRATGYASPRNSKVRGKFLSTCQMNASRLKRYRIEESRSHTTAVARRWVVDVGGSTCKMVSSSPSGFSYVTVDRCQRCFNLISSEIHRKAFLVDRMLSTKSTMTSGVRRHWAYWSTAAVHATLCTHGAVTFAATKNWWWSHGDRQQGPLHQQLPNAIIPQTCPTT